MATGCRRPTVALVTASLGRQPGPSSPLVELVAATRDRFRFVVVAREVPDHARELVEWHRVPPAPGPLRVQWAHFFLRASARLRALRPDLVHSIGPSPVLAGPVDLATVTFHWAGYDRALRSGRKTGGSIVEAVGRRTMLAVEGRCYRPGRVRMLSTLSEAARHELASAVPGVPVALTSRGVDCRRFRPDPAARSQVRTGAGVGEDEVVAVFVGRERRDTKGLELAIRAVARARAAGTGPARLWVLGTTGRRWRALVTRLDVEGGVDLLGDRDDVERFLAAADVFVLPTVYEVFCRAAHEAAAAGLAIVAPPVHAVAQLVGDDQAGLIVERDVDAIAAALSSLAGDGKLRARLGAEARRRALAVGAGSYPPAVAFLYEQLLARPRAATAA